MSSRIFIGRIEISVSDVIEVFCFCRNAGYKWIQRGSVECDSIITIDFANNWLRKLIGSNTGTQDTIFGAKELGENKENRNFFFTLQIQPSSCMSRMGLFEDYDGRKVDCKTVKELDDSPNPLCNNRFL